MKLLLNFQLRINSRILLKRDYLLLLSDISYTQLTKAFIQFLARLLVSLGPCPPSSFSAKDFLNRRIRFLLVASLPIASIWYRSLMVMIWSPNLIDVSFSSTFPFYVHSWLMIFIWEPSWLLIRSFSKLISFLYLNSPVLLVIGKISQRTVSELVSCQTTPLLPILQVFNFILQMLYYLFAKRPLFQNSKTPENLSDSADCTPKRIHEIEQSQWKAAGIKHQVSDAQLQLKYMSTQFYFKNNAKLDGQTHHPFRTVAFRQLGILVHQFLFRLMQCDAPPCKIEYFYSVKV